MIQFTEVNYVKVCLLKMGLIFKKHFRSFLFSQKSTQYCTLPWWRCMRHSRHSLYCCWCRTPLHPNLLSWVTSLNISSAIDGSYKKAANKPWKWQMYKMRFYRIFELITTCFNEFPIPNFSISLSNQIVLTKINKQEWFWSVKKKSWKFRIMDWEFVKPSGE